MPLLRGQTVFAGNLDDYTFMPADFSSLEIAVGRQLGMSYSAAYRCWASMYLKPTRPLSEVFPNEAFVTEDLIQAWEKSQRRTKLHLRKTWYERINLMRVD